MKRKEGVQLVKGRCEGEKQDKNGEKENRGEENRNNGKGMGWKYGKVLKEEEKAHHFLLLY